MSRGMEIGVVHLDGKLLLAPMAGVTDAAFRHICAKHGAAMTTTEMVSARALVYHDQKTAQLLCCLPEDHPVAVQIFGHEPAVMAEAAGLALSLSGADILDINMGCPVGKIAAHGDGCGLMRTPVLAREIVEAVTAAVEVPVTVKFRKGWDKGSVNAVEFAKMCQESGASAITVHGRTRAQMYEGRADWDILREIKEAVDIPVIANGDVFSPEDARHILDYTGCDGAMIGRGSFGDPWIFSRGNAAVAGESIPDRPDLAERMDLAVEQITLSAALRGERTACLEARRHLAWYLRGIPFAGVYKAEAVHVETLADVRRVAAGVKRDLRDPPAAAARSAE